MSFSDQVQIRVFGDDVRISVRITDRRVDEYHVPREDVLLMVQEPVPGPDWLIAPTIKVKMGDDQGLMALLSSPWKWDIYSLSPGALVGLWAQLRADLGVC